MKLEFNINLEQKQTLSMTPELIQAIRILQYNAQELETYVDEQLQENPLLETEAPEAAEEIGEAAIQMDGDFDDRREEKRKGDEDFDWSEYLNQREYDDISYKHFGFRSVTDEDYAPYERATREDESLSAHLLAQLEVADISDRKKLIGEYIIESLDGNGFMTQSAEEIAEALSEDIVRVRKVIAFIQTFDPIGVGAENLRETLILQLGARSDLGEDDLSAAEAIVKYHLTDLAENRMREMSKTLRKPICEVQRLTDIIRTLEPKPGRRFGLGDTRYILPDVIVEKDSDGYSVSLNAVSSPSLYVSPYYRQVLASEEKDSETAKFLSGRLNSALWLIKSIEQRNQTIYNVVKAVVDSQTAFLDGGEKYLKPLTLKKIADAVGIHESTVSRTVNGKYMQTHRGIFEIKYFFKSGVRDGSPEGVSSGGIKALIREMIEAEDTASPLSDQNIADMLAERGIIISRRTVAKYREGTGIPSSSGRRRYT